MANFRLRRQVTTRQPVLRVDPGLPEGKYRFRLVMVDAKKKRHKPVFITVKIGPKKGQRVPGSGVARVGDSSIVKAAEKKPASKKSTKKTTRKKAVTKKVANQKITKKKTNGKRHL